MEKKDGAVLFGQRVEGVVKRRAKLEEISEDGYSRWRREEVLGFLL